MINSSVLAYANVNARVRGMIGKLLQPSTFARLNACSDLGSLLGTLKETDYASYLTSVKEGDLSTRRASYEIRKKLAYAFGVIIKNAPEFAQPLLRQLFLLYEVDNLKAVLRGIEIGESWEKIRYMLFPMESFPTLPFENMVRAGDIASAVEIIRHTPYHRVLSLAMERYRSENSLFPLEVALDLNYWQVVWQQVNALPHQDKEIAKKIIGLIIDRNNLTWAARYRLYHHLSEEEIINYTLPFGYKINDTVIRSIAAGKELPELLLNAYPKMAQTINLDGEVTQKLPLIEIQLTRMFLSTCKSAFVGSTFNIGFLLAYIFLLEIEIQDLTLLIEAKSLGIQQESYAPYLINEINMSSSKKPQEIMK